MRRYTTISFYCDIRALKANKKDQINKKSAKKNGTQSKIVLPPFNVQHVSLTAKF